MRVILHPSIVDLNIINRNNNNNLSLNPSNFGGEILPAARTPLLRANSGCRYAAGVVRGCGGGAREWIQWDTAGYSGYAAKWLDTGIQRYTKDTVRYRQDSGEIQMGDPQNTRQI